VHARCARPRVQRHVERIRQIEFKALHKLQALVDTDRLGVGEAGDFT